MDRRILMPSVGVVTVMPRKRCLTTVPSGVVQVEGKGDLYFHDPLGRSAAASKQPIKLAAQAEIRKLNTPELRASGAASLLQSVEVPQMLQEELRDTISTGNHNRSLDSAVRAFVKSFAAEHAVTKLFVSTLMLWQETNNQYELDVGILLRSALGRRLLVSHTLQLKAGRAILTLAQVHANFEAWATQVWTFDVADNAKRALLRVPAYNKTEIPPELELAVLANDGIRSNPKFTRKQRNAWAGLPDNGRFEFSAALAEHLGINRRKVVRALDGVVTISSTAHLRSTKLNTPQCIQQFMGGKHLDHSSRRTLSAIFSKVGMLIGNSSYVDCIIEALAAHQSEKSMVDLRLVRKADDKKKQHGGDDFLPQCQTLRERGFCPAKSTADCAARHGVRDVSHNQNPAHMMVGQSTPKVTSPAPQHSHKKRRLNSTVSESDHYICTDPSFA
jgi:hypothetical protein